MSTLYLILAIVFAALAVAGVLYVISTGNTASKLWYIAPVAAALVFSNLNVRARHEGK